MDRFVNCLVANCFELVVVDQLLPNLSATRPLATISLTRRSCRRLATISRLLQKAAAEGATLVCCLVVLQCAVRLNVLGISATVVQRLWRKAPWAWVHMLIACTLPMCVLLNKHACTPHFQIIADGRDFDASNSSSGMGVDPSPFCVR